MFLVAVLVFMSITAYSEGGVVEPFCIRGPEVCQQRILVPSRAEVIITEPRVIPGKVEVRPPAPQ